MAVLPAAEREVRIRGPCRRHRRRRVRIDRGAGRAGGRRGGARSRARREARRQHGALDRAHSGGGHAISARARHRGFTRAARRRHLAQGEGRDRPRDRRYRRARLRTDHRVARRPPRCRIQARRGVPVPGTLGATHARDAASHRRGARGRAARLRGTARHRHHGRARSTDLYASTTAAWSPCASPVPTGRRTRSGATRSCSPAAASAATRTWSVEHIPEIADAEFWGHVGNKGDAIKWGLRSARPSPTWAATRAMAPSPRPTATRSTGGCSRTAATR